jgi:hypothetical protein
MKRFVVLGLAALLVAPMLKLGDARETARASRLSDAALANIVGGVGAAQTNVVLPEDLVKPNLYSGGVAWNKPGARCQFGCTSSDVKPSNQGYNVDVPQIAVLTVLGTPKIEVLGDGLLKSGVTATQTAVIGDFTVFKANLATRCVGGPTPGAVCSSTNVCGDGGECRACDHNNNCATDSDPTPCSKTCSYGNNAGKPCVTANPDCPTASPNVYATCQVQAFGLYSQTCYALSSCGSGGNGCNDCRDNGAGLTAGASGHNKFLHTVTGQVLASGVTISRVDRVFQIVNGDASNPKTTCSSNCSGAADVSECVGASCTFPPNCG